MSMCEGVICFFVQQKLQRIESRADVILSQFKIKCFVA